MLRSFMITLVMVYHSKPLGFSRVCVCVKGSRPSLVLQASPLCVRHPPRQPPHRESNFESHLVHEELRVSKKKPALEWAAESEKLES